MNTQFEKVNKINELYKIIAGNTDRRFILYIGDFIDYFHSEKFFNFEKEKRNKIILKLIELWDDLTFPIEAQGINILEIYDFIIGEKYKDII